MRDETREEILKEVEERIKTMVKELLEALMKEEREIYLENHPTKANGYYTWDLLTLAGPLENLKVPRVREGDFHPHPLPKAGLAGTFRGYLRSLCSRCKHPEDLGVLGRGLRGVLLAPKHPLPHRSHFGLSKALAGKALERGVLRGASGWDFSHHPPKKRPRDPWT